MENTQQIVEILTQQTQVLQGIYIVLLFSVGVISAGFVCYVLYKLLRIFF